MKYSNFILIFSFVLVTSCSLHSQSNSTHVISIENDDESIYLKYEDGEVSELKIDGQTIKQSDYDKYQYLLDKYEHRSGGETHIDADDSKDNEKSDMQAILNKRIRNYLSENDVLNSYVYSLKLTPKKVVLNGNRLSSKVLNKCLDIFKETAGYQLSPGSFFKVDITPNSKSITLSIED